jgi:hypothetical protein
VSVTPPQPGGGEYKYWRWRNLIMDMEKAKQALIGLALANHIGDVNDCIPEFCIALNLECRWSDKWERYIFPWEENRWIDGDGE